MIFDQQTVFSTLPAIFAFLILSYALHEMDRVVCCGSFDRLLLFALGYYYFKKYCCYRCGFNRNKFWETGLYSFFVELFLCHFSSDSKTMGQALEPGYRCIEHSMGCKKLFDHFYVQGRRMPGKTNWIMACNAWFSAYIDRCPFP